MRGRARLCARQRVLTPRRRRAMWKTAAQRLRPHRPPALIRPASARSSSGRPPASASRSLGQPRPIGSSVPAGQPHRPFFPDIGGTPRCAEWTATRTLQLASTRGWVALAHDGRCEPGELARTIPVMCSESRTHKVHLNITPSTFSCAFIERHSGRRHSGRAYDGDLPCLGRVQGQGDPTVRRETAAQRVQSQPKAT